MARYDLRLLTEKRLLILPTRMDTCRDDQLSVDPELVARPPDASFQHIAHAQLVADLLCIDGFIPIGKRGIARDHEHAREPRQIGRQILGDTIGKILLLSVVAEIGERQHDDRQAWCDEGLGDREASGFRRPNEGIQRS
jgi:hypothetical protein